MKNRVHLTKPLFQVLAIILLTALGAHARTWTSADGKSTFVGDYPFTPAPLANGRPWLIKNFGPVGIGIMLEKGPVMKIQNVEAGSPAEKAGRLNQGDIIESINGVKLSDTKRDPRLVLGGLIAQAEASDGRINLEINGKGAVTTVITPDYHCGYTVYMRKPQAK